MPEIYEVLGITEYTTRDTNEKKPRFTKIGVMFPRKNGDGFTMTLDGHVTSGRYLIKLKDDSRGQGSGGRGAASGGVAGGEDKVRFPPDDIPF